MDMLISMLQQDCTHQALERLTMGLPEAQQLLNSPAFNILVASKFAGIKRTPEGELEPMALVQEAQAAEVAAVLISYHAVHQMRELLWYACICPGSVA